VLTTVILFAMNVLILAGLVVMVLTLITLNRMGQAGKLLSIGLMADGRGDLVGVRGLYASGWSN
jgi:hypothetical protein